MDLCYIFRRNAITSSALENAETLLDRFHQLRQFFIDAGVRTSISLPRQHALLHYITSIPLFGSPNGLCSSITESKHIKAVKEPWRRSNRFRALPQMLRTIVRLEKLSALRQRFSAQGMLTGSTAGFVARLSQLRQADEEDNDGGIDDASDLMDVDDGEPEGCATQDVEKERMQDAGPDDGPRALSSITLASTAGTSSFKLVDLTITLITIVERKYPKSLYDLAHYIDEAEFPSAFLQFLYSRRHPNHPVPDDVITQVHFTGKIHVFHSAITRFYAPSDLCGAGGMYRQRIRSNPSWYGYPRRDTVFVVQDEDQPGMDGLLVARVHLFFSFFDDYDEETVPCALVSWFVPASRRRDPETGMWMVKAEGSRRHRPIQVIHLKSIARGAHLVPKFGGEVLPDHISYVNALDEFQTYFVNPYIDHHCHEFLSD